MSNVPPNSGKPNGSPAQGSGWQPPKLPPLPPRPQFPSQLAGTPVPSPLPQHPVQPPQKPPVPTQEPNGWGTPQVPQSQAFVPEQPVYQPPAQEPIPSQTTIDGPSSKTRNKMVLLIAGGVVALLVLLLVIGGVSFLIGKSLPTNNAAVNPNGGTTGSSSQQPNNSTFNEPKSGPGDLKMGSGLPAGATVALWDTSALANAGWRKSEQSGNGIDSFTNKASGCAAVVSSTKLTGILNQGVDEAATLNIFPVIDERIQAADVNAKGKTVTFGLTGKNGLVDFKSYGMVTSDKTGWQVIAARAYAKQDVGSILVVNCNDEKTANTALESMRGLVTLSVQK